MEIEHLRDLVKEILYHLIYQDHPNINKIYAYYMNDDELFIVCEFLYGGELFDYVVQKRSFDYKEAADVMQ